MSKAAKFLEIELTDHNFRLQDIDSRAFSHVRALVRFGGVPLGYLWINLKSGYPAPSLEEIRLGIAAEFKDSLLRGLVMESLCKNEAGLLSEAELPPVTVAVVTRNRPQSLDRCLKSFARLDYPREKLQVLVVDNNPSDDSARRVVSGFPGFEYVVEPRPGVEFGRNRVINRAKHEIIAYTDDDVEVSPNWVRAVAQAFRNPQVAAVTGRIVPGRLATETQQIFEEFNSFDKGPEKFYSPTLYNLSKFFPLDPWRLGVGANMSFRKSVLQKIGGFDGTLGPGSVVGTGGDMDIFYRIARAGYILSYEPSVLLWHHHRDTVAGLEKQLTTYKIGFYALLTKWFITDKPMRGKILAFLVWTFYFVDLRVLQNSSGMARALKWKQIVKGPQGIFRYLRSMPHTRRITEQYGEIDLTGENRED